MILTVEEMENRVDNILPTIYSEIEQGFRIFSELFLQQIRVHQLEEKGEDGNRVKLRIPYSERWATIRRSHSLPTNRRTLKFSGDFYESLVIEFNSDDFTIESKGVDYAKYLTSDNGIDILRPDAEFIYDLFFAAVMPEIKRILL